MSNSFSISSLVERPALAMAINGCANWIPPVPKSFSKSTKAPVFFCASSIALRKLLTPALVASWDMLNFSSANCICLSCDSPRPLSDEPKRNAFICSLNSAADLPATTNAVPTAAMAPIAVPLPIDSPPNSDVRRPIAGLTRLTTSCMLRNSRLMDSLRLP